MSTNLLTPDIPRLHSIAATKPWTALSCASLASKSEGSPATRQSSRDIDALDCELMSLSCLHDQQPATFGAQLTGQRIVEVPVLETLDEKGFDQIQRGPNWFGIAGLYKRRDDFRHCAAAPSYP